MHCEHLGNKARSQHRLRKKCKGHTRDQKVSGTRPDQEGQVPGAKGTAQVRARPAVQGGRRGERLAQSQGSVRESKGQREQSRMTQAKNQTE